MNCKFSNLSPETQKGCAHWGNLGEAALETRGEILGWTDTGGKWMWAHRLTQTLGLCPQGKVSLSFSNSRVPKIFLGANGILLQVQFKSRSVGLLLKKKANSHLPESELRGAREADQLRKGKRLENRRVWKCSRALAAERRFRRQCLTIMSLWFLEFM